jgi:hypothetical protein
MPPMTDLVERLRDWAAQMRVGETNITAAHLVPHDLLEAADEIERLRALVVRMGCRLPSRATDEIDRLRVTLAEEIAVARETDDALTKAEAEIERLRAALKEIAGLEYDHVAMVDVARIALKDKP